MVLISRPPHTWLCVRDACGVLLATAPSLGVGAAGPAAMPPSHLPFLPCAFPHPERCLEDHELVVQVESTMAGDSKFLFRKNYAKYEFFKNPTVSVISSGSGRGTFS